VNKKFTEQTVTIVTLNLEMQKRDHLFNRFLTHFSTFRGYGLLQKDGILYTAKSFSSKQRTSTSTRPCKDTRTCVVFFGGGFPRGIYRTWRHVLGRFTTGRPPGLDKPKLVSSPQTSMYHPPEIQQKST
jgi:hypothetical protein